MKITVAGLWHLGCVTAACCAKHFQVTGLDFDAALIRELQAGKAPTFEPGLDELLAEGLTRARLSFTDRPEQACADTELLWLTYDTPVNEQDEPDAQFVLDRLHTCLRYLPAGRLVLISSQLPVGTCRRLEKEYPQFSFASSPENLRLGKALETFQQADRIVAGVRDSAGKEVLDQLFRPFTGQILWMRPESAEMVKHALNSFLAVSVTFINEVAGLCEQTGADAGEVSQGLKTDLRIGPRAYLSPGSAIAGGTLARDVTTLARLAAESKKSLPMISAVMPSNERHRAWAYERLRDRLGRLRGKSVAVLGLTYKPNTDTLRRSASVELCQELLADGAAVRAFDPVVKSLPPELSKVSLAKSLPEALTGADAAVVGTEWPEFRKAPWGELLQIMRARVIIDASRFLERQLAAEPGVELFSVGRA